MISEAYRILSKLVTFKILMSGNPKRIARHLLRKKLLKKQKGWFNWK